MLPLFEAKNSSTVIPKTIPDTTLRHNTHQTHTLCCRHTHIPEVQGRKFVICHSNSISRSSASRETCNIENTVQLFVIGPQEHGRVAGRLVFVFNLAKLARRERREGEALGERGGPVAGIVDWWEGLERGGLSD